MCVCVCVRLYGGGPRAIPCPSSKFHRISYFFFFGLALSCSGRSEEFMMFIWKETWPTFILCNELAKNGGRIRKGLGIPNDDGEHHQWQQKTIYEKKSFATFGQCFFFSFVRLSGKGVFLSVFLFFHGRSVLWNSHSGRLKMEYVRAVAMIFYLGAGSDNDDHCLMWQDEWLVITIPQRFFSSFFSFYVSPCLISHRWKCAISYRDNLANQNNSEIPLLFSKSEILEAYWSRIMLKRPLQPTQNNVGGFGIGTRLLMSILVCVEKVK